MKITLVCHTCGKGAKNPTGVVPNKQNSFLINNDNVYQFECVNGHLNSVLLQSEKFQILFESAANAIKEDHVGLSILGFAASLERFYEFFIQVILMKGEVPRQDKEVAWKIVTNQSERQIGAFTFLYLLKFKKPPKQLDAKLIEFRNRVIHKGEIPTKADALKYGQGVLDLINELIKDLNSTMRLHLSQTIMSNMIKRDPIRVEMGTKRSVVQFQTIISLDPNPQIITLSDFLNSN